MSSGPADTNQAGKVKRNLLNKSNIDVKSERSDYEW